MTDWEANRDRVFFNSETSKYSTLSNDESALIAKIFEAEKEQGGIVTRIMSNVFNRIKLNINKLSIIIVEPMTHFIFDIEEVRFGDFKDIVVESELDPMYLKDKQQKVVKITGISLD